MKNRYKTHFFLHVKSKNTKKYFLNFSTKTNSPSYIIKQTIQKLKLSIL